MKYFIGFLITVGLIVLMFFLIIRGFSGNKTTTTTTKSTAKAVNYANTNTEVTMNVRGRIIADQEHLSYKITVGRSAVQLNTYRGYDGQVIESRTYTNTQESYAEFLRAIDFAGYMNGASNAPADTKDDRGVCANGRVYAFEVVSGSSVNQRFWASNCRNIRGTFRGDATEVKRLFDRQVPSKDFNTLVSSLNL